MIGKTLTAGLFLTFNLALHILRRLKAALLGTHDGFARFAENFSHEGIFPLDPAERQMYPGFSSCINCGICLFGNNSLPLSGEMVDPRLFAVSFSRDLGSQSVGWEAAMDPDRGESSVRMCPTLVPLRRMLTFMIHSRRGDSSIP